MKGPYTSRRNLTSSFAFSGVGFPRGLPGHILGGVSGSATVANAFTARLVFLPFLVFSM
jgi:hypothetical protein